MRSSRLVAVDPRALWLWLAAGAGALLLLATAGAAAPRLASGPTLCLVRAASGVPCPACGLTRASAWLARGEGVRAVALHPLAPALLLEAGVAWLWWGAILLGRARWPPRRFAMALLWANLLLLFGTWAVRFSNGSLP